MTRSRSIIVPIAIDIEIPANTTEEKTLLKAYVPAGRIVGISIDIPSGWAYLAGFKVLNNGAQIIPAMFRFERYVANNQLDDYITGDDTNIDQTVDIPIEEGTLEIRGVNFDPSNSHRAVLIIFFKIG